MVVITYYNTRISPGPSDATIEIRHQRPMATLVDRRDVGRAAGGCSAAVGRGHRSVRMDAQRPPHSQHGGPSTFTAGRAKWWPIPSSAIDAYDVSFGPI
jgi:hypothetical protein